MFCSGLEYKAREDDIFVVTYPKSGTTWMQQICILLFADGELPTDVIEKSHDYRSPYLEFMGKEAIEKRPRPGIIKTHLPYEYVPKNPKAKYIYVMRNPKDACVSFYYYFKSLKNIFDGSFDDFLLCFLKGELPYNSYAEHIRSWWAHRKDENVLFMFYEEMIENIRNSVLKIASFIGDEYREKLDKNPEILDKILKNSEKSVMRETTGKSYEDKLRELTGFVDNATRFVRKGIVGDWRNVFSEEQNSLFEQWFRNEFQGTEIECLWDKVAEDIIE
ncbi:Sulfotransferase 1C2A-like protein [Leptotrombidium deliense]|uniref:Sulfotransferase 1C2A-like protein n=1 Tax=Leptotrombidium deliense TaxID=299467 RepID=A0A443S5E6_9ACAR|nr:Sulfotransferase 1C2A-like protein [Leptotrombidium deliense]